MAPFDVVTYTLPIPVMLKLLPAWINVITPLPIPLPTDANVRAGVPEEPNPDNSIYCDELPSAINHLPADERAILG